MTSLVAWNESTQDTIRRQPAVDRSDFVWPRPSATRYSPLRALAVEHEVRSLLNLIGLVSHCLRVCEATENERAQWRREAERANQRLGRLRAAGWCPTLLRSPCAGAISDA